MNLSNRNIFGVDKVKSGKLHFSILTASKRLQMKVTDLNKIYVLSCTHFLYSLQNWIQFDFSIMYLQQN
jgi:hypothetical protein